MEVYVFEGKKKEIVPRSVQKLVVNEGVQKLPRNLCSHCGLLQEVILPNGVKYIRTSAFECCDSLVEINIRNTVQYIGRASFFACEGLKKVELDVSISHPHELQTIGVSAFHCCYSLSRIKLPSSVTCIQHSVFRNCTALIEASLDATQLNLIPLKAFAQCSSLQTVGLPNTLQQIEEQAFANCQGLVTVVVSSDSLPIKIGEESFYGCCRLANIELAKGSTAEDNSFTECKLLSRRYSGRDSPPIVAALTRRFANYPIHKMCYHHLGITAVQLRQSIGDQHPNDLLLDTFEMTLFHVLFTTLEPKIELLDVLLDSLPNEILNWKDANGQRPTDYLVKNWTDGKKSLFHRSLQKGTTDRLAIWGATSWAEDMQSKIHDVLEQDDLERRVSLYNEAYSALEHYENVEATSILEMALWRMKAKSRRANDGSKRQTLDQEDCRLLNGSDVVVPLVTAFLGIPRTSD